MNERDCKVRFQKSQLNIKAMKKISIALILLFTLSSCHHLMSQNVNINPDLDKVETNGAKRSVFVNVKDKRNNRGLIGKRWQVLGGSINSYQNVSTALKEELLGILEDSGFKVGTDRKIELTITSLEYNTKLGLFSMGYYTDFAVNMMVKDAGDNVKYYDSFNDRIEKTSVFGAPLAETNERLINQVISRVLNRALSDQDFLKSLQK